MALLWGCYAQDAPSLPLLSERSGPASGPSTEAAADALATEPPADTTPRIRYVGRTDRSDPKGPRIAWPGTRIVVRFRGTTLRARLRETSIDGSSQFDVVVDGAPQPAVLVLDSGEHDYVIADALAPGEHVVALHRRTEAMVGVTQVLGFDFPNGELLAPPPAPKRRIEFLGDSGSTGYGVDCASTYEAFTAETENAERAFPSLVATTLKAETHNESFSGKGVMRNHEDADHVYFGDVYRRAVPLLYDAPWDFAWQADVVWITLGGNDWSLGSSGARAAPDARTFQDRYAELVAFVRAKNPAAQIVCAVAGSMSDDHPVGYRARTQLRTILGAVVDARHAAGDARVHYHELPRAQSGDLTGCSGHPNATYHRKAAEDVAAAITEITGWH